MPEARQADKIACVLIPRLINYLEVLPMDVQRSPLSLPPLPDGWKKPKGFFKNLIGRHKDCKEAANKRLSSFKALASCYCAMYDGGSRTGEPIKLTDRSVHVIRFLRRSEADIKGMSDQSFAHWYCETRQDFVARAQEIGQTEANLLLEPDATIYNGSLAVSLARLALYRDMEKLGVEPASRQKCASAFVQRLQEMSQPHDTMVAIQRAVNGYVTEVLGPAVSKWTGFKQAWAPAPSATTPVSPVSPASLPRTGADCSTLSSELSQASENISVAEEMLCQAGLASSDAGASSFRLQANNSIAEADFIDEGAGSDSRRQQQSAKPGRSTLGRSRRVEAAH